ncbi:hemolysin family protein [Lipingzhangella rawalii]
MPFGSIAALPVPRAGVLGSAGSWSATVLVAAVLLSGFAAAMVSVEVALTRVVRTVATAEPDGGIGTRWLRAIAADTTRYVNVLLLVRVSCEVLAALLLMVALVALLGLVWHTVVLAALIMIVANYVLIGVTPRILGRQFPEPVARSGAVFLYPTTLVLGPLAQALVMLGRALTPPGRGDRERPFTSEDELRQLVDLAEEGHVIDAEEREMIHSVFKLDDTRVREVMVPRTDIVFLESRLPVLDGLSAALDSGYSRIPVAGENLDDLVGIVYVKDMAQAAVQGQGSVQLRVGDVMRAATYVPDSKPIDGLLREMQQDRTHVAVVIDEYGGTAGLVTIEDIVEEIVGEITDEYDDETPPVAWIGPDTARVVARLPLGELGELFGVSIDTEDVGDVATVGGLLAYVLGEVPVTGSRAVYGSLELEAEHLSGDRERTDTVLVRRVPIPSESQDGKSDSNE